jgi:tetratricopeptide (TPR) repeat protein
MEQREDKVPASSDGRSASAPASGIVPGDDSGPAVVETGRADALQRTQPKDRLALFAVLLIVAALLIYQPAWNGEILVDDDVHITKPELRSLQGLWRIWFDLGAVVDYYPLTHTAFWLQHWLWGDSTLGYHLVNIILHAIAAVMVAMILRRLEVPGAYLAAAIFAFHPVCVESVAWISELKNILSGVLYLGAVLSYLRFDRTRHKGPYALAVVLFVLGILSKTATATLPAALLVIFWWKRGRLTWRRDVLPLVPLFVLGIAAGLFTVWVEREFMAAKGEEFGFTAIERCLIAGRVVWFYLGKLLWPAGLIFVYPRWNVSQAVWWQYLFPIASVVLLVVLWALRRRSRAPLAAMLFFAGTLFPVMGFFNFGYSRLSFVADHLQYLPSLGVITLSASLLVIVLRRYKAWGRPAGRAIAAAILTILAVLSWRQARIYGSADTLYRQTLARNGDCWLAHNNLGSMMVEQGRPADAIEHYRQAIGIKPDYYEARYSLANVLSSLGRTEEAIEQFKEVVRLEPKHIWAYNNLGIAFADQGRIDAAIEYFEKAVEIKPDYFKPHFNLGRLYLIKGRLDEAVKHYREATRIEPGHLEAHYNLGSALALQGRTEEAIRQYRQVLLLKADYAEAHASLGLALDRQGEPDEAIKHYRQALLLEADHAEAQANLGIALDRQGKLDEAIEHYRHALRIKPDSLDVSRRLGLALIRKGKGEEAIEHYRQVLRRGSDEVEACNNLAWLLATQRVSAKRDLEEAVTLAQRACGLTGHGRADCLDTLAVAYAASGRFADAVATARKAVDVAKAVGQGQLASEINERLELYRAGKPYRQEQPTSAPAH